ncbi:mobile element protein [Xanthomonas phage vB_XooS_NR08]|nr:mobile element protein [Xanthomonas phage vB_XooS_NR08]
MDDRLQWSPRRSRIIWAGLAKKASLSQGTVTSRNPCPAYLSSYFVTVVTVVTVPIATRRKKNLCRNISNGTNYWPFYAFSFPVREKVSVSQCH